MKARFVFILVAATLAFLAAGLFRQSIQLLQTQRRRHDALALRLSSLQEQARLAALASGHPAARGAVTKVRAAATAQHFNQFEAQVASLIMNQQSRRMLARAVAELELYVRPRFTAFGLSDEQWDSYEVLAAQRTLVAQAEAQRPGRPANSFDENTAASIKAATASLEEQMRTVVGDQAFSELNESFNYLDRPKSDPAGGTWLQDISNLLLFSDSPLTPDQAAALKSLRPTLAQAPAVQGILGPDQFQVWMNIQQQAELQAKYK